ncbi:hypothetical protein HaLaN_30741 [Haematococcus lacustris]|uniref:Uncharacterized protein n=1 Tax=Haematococcus lacustris TaxID=44745 RepID=A0A6A0AFI3_HAELA|nr:hypothetical protein HaLaN_30741 [Haematococcus lacustris]
MKLLMMTDDGRLKMRWRVLLQPPPVEDEELVELLQAYNAMFQDVVQVHEVDEEGEAVRGLMVPGAFGSVHPPPLLRRRAHGAAVREAVVQRLSL